ncbi:hypothetical protein LFM09_49595 [Lentzea alba]|uniref:hypothetical protein n=1 Tax=Lentzea alba TaxID=2714351 RepID=UPI0039BF3CE6
MRKIFLVALAICLLQPAVAHADTPVTEVLSAEGGAQLVDIGAPLPAVPARQPGRSAAAPPRHWFGAYQPPITLQPNQYIQAWGYCPDGMLVTGGGASVTSYGLTIMATQPLDGGNGWKVLIVNNGDVDATFKVHRVCFSGLSNYQIASRKIVVAPYTSDGVSASCPSGTSAVGGGGETDSFWGRNGTYPVVPGLLDWRFYFNNRESVARTATAYAVCAWGINNLGTNYVGAAVDNGQYGRAAKACFPGRVVVSGGYFSLADQGAYGPRWTDSFPSSATEWTVYGYNDTGRRGYVEAHAVCGN